MNDKNGESLIAVFGYLLAFIGFFYVVAAFGYYVCGWNESFEVFKILSVTVFMLTLGMVIINIPVFLKEKKGNKK